MQSCFVLQNLVEITSASQIRVRMAQFAILPPVDTRADAIITILGRTVIVSIILLYTYMYLQETDR